MVVLNQVSDYKLAIDQMGCDQLTLVWGQDDLIVRWLAAASRWHWWWLVRPGIPFIWAARAEKDKLTQVRVSLIRIKSFSFTAVGATIILQQHALSDSNSLGTPKEDYQTHCLDLGFIGSYIPSLSCMYMYNVYLDPLTTIAAYFSSIYLAMSINAGG